MSSAMPVRRATSPVKPIAQQSHVPQLSSVVQTKGNGLPNRYALHAVEHWGKTSFAAQFKHVIFIETKGETGLETLINEGRLDETPHFPEAQTWEEILGYIDALLTQDHPYRVLAIDALNGLERLCHEYTCRKDFNGKWGNDGFASYQKGPEVALTYWREFLAKLDRLRAEKRMTVVLLCHTKVKGFNNPEGANYDRYTPDLNEKSWGLTHKWCDVVLFGNFEVTLTDVNEGAKGPKRGKGVGGSHRVLYTERTAAYDAKNRLGLPEEIDMGDSAEQAFSNFVAELKEARQRNFEMLRGEAPQETADAQPETTTEEGGN